jgi:hypothetical protein
MGKDRVLVAAAVVSVTAFAQTLEAAPPDQHIDSASDVTLAISREPLRSKTDAVVLTWFTVLGSRTHGKVSATVIRSRLLVTETNDDALGAGALNAALVAPRALRSFASTKIERIAVDVLANAERMQRQGADADSALMVALDAALTPEQRDAIAAQLCGAVLGSARKPTLRELDVLRKAAFIVLGAASNRAFAAR